MVLTLLDTTGTPAAIALADSLVLIVKYTANPLRRPARAAIAEARMWQQSLLAYLLWEDWRVVWRLSIGGDGVNQE